MEKLDAPRPASSKKRRVLFAAPLVLYALFLAFCVWVLVQDPPGQSGGGGAQGVFGFIATMAGGFPGSLLLFRFMTVCEHSPMALGCETLRLHQTGFLMVVAAGGALLNLSILGALALWGHSIRWPQPAAKSQTPPAA